MPLLKVDHLTKRFAGLLANDSIGFELTDGAIFALIGPNGAGKSTLFNLISGFYAPTSGRVWLEGRDITGMPQHGIAALGLVRTYQLVELFRELTVAENVQAGFHLRTRGGFFSALARPPWIQRQAGQLSYGQQRRLELARTLPSQPKLLLLDEPAAGLTPQETLELAGLIRGIHEQGVTILLIEHDMELVMSLAQHIIVLDAGRKIAEGTPEEVRSNPDVTAAYLGGGALNA